MEKYKPTYDSFDVRLRCPCCSNEIRNYDIMVDSFVKEILQSVPYDINQVEISSDGSWKISQVDKKADGTLIVDSTPTKGVQQSATFTSSVQVLNQPVTATPMDVQPSNNDQK